MTLRRIDARFLLPHPVRRAAVLPGIEGWREELERIGVEVDPTGDEPLDLVVAPATRAQEAAALHPRAAILEGRGGRNAARPRRRFLPLPASGEPLVYVPIGESGPARYAFATWAFGDKRWKRLRNRVVGALAGYDALPPVRPEVLVSSLPEQPFVVRAALDHGLVEDVRPLLLAGQGDDYSRAVFLLFERGSAEPSWALKFQRLPSSARPFEAEKRGLALAAEAGGSVAAHAPRWVGGDETEGLRWTLETAAHGKALLPLLRSGRADLVERICEWQLETSRSTLARPDALSAERRRLAEQVLPAWNLGPDLVNALDHLPAVLQHNDLGSWNIVVEEQDFTVLDWEDCIRHGLPLWDLLYFLADAAAHLDGITHPGERGPHFEQLFLGEAPSSPLVFRWVRRAVDTLELPAGAVGPIATLCWLHHGLSGDRRAAGTSDARSGEYVAHRVFRDFAERWLHHPGLGPGWEGWR